MDTVEQKTNRLAAAIKAVGRDKIRAIFDAAINPEEAADRWAQMDVAQMLCESLGLPAEGVPKIGKTVAQAIVDKGVTISDLKHVFMMGYVQAIKSMGSLGDVVEACAEAQATRATLHA